MSIEDRFEERHHAANTRKTYRSRVNVLEHPPALDAASLRSWVRKHTDGAPVGTALPTRAAAQHYLVAECGVDEDTARRAMPKIGKDSRARAVPSHAEMDLLYTFLEAEAHGNVRTILLLLPETGLRISEACTLRREAIVRAQGGRLLLNITGKGAKARSVPLTERAALLLHPHLQEGSSDAPEISTWLFRGKKGAGPITEDAVRVAMRRWATEHPDRFPTVTPHQLRHWFATNALRNGGDIAGLQKVLGHESLETTAIYTHPDVGQLFDLVDKGTRK